MAKKKDKKDEAKKKAKKKEKKGKKDKAKKKAKKGKTKKYWAFSDCMTFKGNPAYSVGCPFLSVVIR